MQRARGVASLLLSGIASAACSAGSAPGEPELLGHTAQALAARCQVTLTNGKTLDVEKDYLPHVVMCENGDATPEALKAQAVAARSYMYAKLETVGKIADGTGDQVYTCGKTPSAAVLNAVKATEGVVARYQNVTVLTHYVQGGAAKAPACKGAAGGTEKYVTYNDGLTGAAVHPSSIDSADARNRGCMSQAGSICLDGTGKKYEAILRFYFGADLMLEQAVGSCVTPITDGGASADASPPPTSPPASPTSPPGEPSAPNAPGATSTTPSASAAESGESGGCVAAPRSVSSSWSALAGLGLLGVISFLRSRGSRARASGGRL